ncbi:hypothetical protein DPMN_031612 [Dreissena polymorpha]|uniref:Uncharacterized protein n=1 Tax=Dreissena polymorpha TaxID=45954 RepID=A0A9D4M341_DREPO|nr:hypothetical protein DPMN_031612 [Dreissena polymorpha]
MCCVRNDLKNPKETQLVRCGDIQPTSRELGVGIVPGEKHEPINQQLRLPDIISRLATCKSK